ncbi:MAG: hypothetical protein ABIK73_07725 [candidate division WOR-3 bacterium]
MEVRENLVQMKNDGFNDYFLVPVYVDRDKFSLILTEGKSVARDWVKKNRINAALSSLGIEKILVVVEDDNNNERIVEPEALGDVDNSHIKGFIGIYKFQSKDI